MTYRFLGVEFELDPYRRPAETIAEEVGVVSEGWPELTRVEVLRAVSSPWGMPLPSEESERHRLAEKMLLLCSLLRAARRIDTSIADWLLSHPSEAGPVSGPLEVFRRATGIRTDLDLQKRLQVSIKDAFWKVVNSWNGLKEPAPVPACEAGSRATIQERVEREQERVRRRAERRVAGQVAAADQASQAKESLRLLYQSLADQCAALSADRRVWVDVQLIETDNGHAEVHVELRRRTRSPARLEVSKRRSRGRTRLQLHVIGGDGRRKEVSLETTDQLSEEIASRIARHIAKQATQTRPDEIARDRAADEEAVQTLIESVERRLESEIADDGAQILDGEEDESFVVVVQGFGDEDPTARIPVSVQRTHPGPAGQRLTINGASCESLRVAKKALHAAVSAALDARRAADPVGNLTYEDGVEKGEGWGLGCSVREAKRFLASYGNRDLPGDICAEAIFEAIFPNAGWPWPDHVEPREDEIVEAEFQAEQDLAEFWGIDGKESDLVDRIPETYLRGFVFGARRAILSRRKEALERKRRER